MQLLVGDPAQARGVAAEATLLRPIVGVQVELPGRVTVDVTV